MRRLLLLAALACTAAPLCADAAPATRAEMKQQLRGARAQLKDTKNGIQRAHSEERKAARQERSLRGQLEQLNRDLETARREQRVHVRNLGLVEDRLRSVRSQLTQKQAEEAADRDALGRDLALLYKARSRQGASLLFSAQSPAALVARTRYLEDLSGATHRRVSGLQDDIQRNEVYRREYKDQARDFLEKKREAEAARRQALGELLKKKALLRKVHDHKIRAATTARELEEAAARLESGLDAIQRSYQQAERQARQAQADQSRARGRPSPRISAVGGRSSLRVGVPWPVRGRIISRFGKHVHPIFHVPVFNRGIQIAAAYGSAVRAVAAGTVCHAAEMEGFGDLVVLDHGGGMMSVYGYGSQLHVTEGQRVAQGDLLEDVGEAGDSTQPALYFEIRQGAKALDPLRYLRRH